MVQFHELQIDRNWERELTIDSCFRSHRILLFFEAGIRVSTRSWLCSTEWNIVEFICTDHFTISIAPRTKCSQQLFGGGSFFGLAFEPWRNRVVNGWGFGETFFTVEKFWPSLVAKRSWISSLAKLFLDETALARVADCVVDIGLVAWVKPFRFGKWVMLLCVGSVSLVAANLQTFRNDNWHIFSI